MVVVPRNKSYDEAEFPGRRQLLAAQGGSIMQLGNDKQGFGAMRIYPGPVAGTNISQSAWTNIPYYNELVLPGELCSLDIATGRFKFLDTGIWRVSVFLSVRHNNAGAYREMNARFYDVASSTGLPIFQIPTGQAATITNFGFTGVYDIKEDRVDKELILQVQGGPTSNYTGVSWETLNLSLNLEGVTL